jgi:GTPase
MRGFCFYFFMSTFVDQITINAKAGDGGNGVVRWRQEKFKPRGGPAGGNGGNGGSFYVRAVRDVARLGKYTGVPLFKAEDGEVGKGLSQHGKNGEDFYLEVPVGSRVTDLAKGRTVELLEEGEEIKILQGGRGGYGNEHFKTSTNRSPQEAVRGTKGEAGELRIDLSLVVDVGLVGFPNAGKSTLINLLTNARSEVGAYQFTTKVPHLGAFYGFLIADIPGLIEGASDNKGLGHTFLRHITKTKMILHLISLESDDVLKDYAVIRKELSQYSEDLSNKKEWIVLTKSDLVSAEKVAKIVKSIDKNDNRVFVINENDQSSIKDLRDKLVRTLENR